MSKYIKVTMIFEHKIIPIDPRSCVNEIRADLAELYKSELTMEPSTLTIEVLETEDDDANL